MGVPERYFAPRTVARWVREAGLQLPCEGVRGQSMVIVGKLPPASLETIDSRSEMQRLARIWTSQHVVGSSGAVDTALCCNSCLTTIVEKGVEE